MKGYLYGQMGKRTQAQGTEVVNHLGVQNSMLSLRKGGGSRVHAQSLHKLFYTELHCTIWQPWLYMPI